METIKISYLKKKTQKVKLIKLINFLKAKIICQTHLKF